MTEEQIVQRLLLRDESGLDALQQTYGSLAVSFAQRIVGSREDAEECVQDAMMSLWSSIPPQQPDSLKHYFLRLVRNKALDQWRTAHREKRGGGELSVVLEELDRVIASDAGIEDGIAEKLLAERINGFLSQLSARDRSLFLRRYYYFESPDEIAAAAGLSKANVSVILFRVRKKLKAFLKKEELL